MELDDSSFQVSHHRFGSRTDLKFLVDTTNVCSNGIQADMELSGNFLVEKTLGQKFQDFLLSRTQIRFRF